MQISARMRIARYVDQDVAQQTISEPERWPFSLWPRNLGEGDFKFIETVMSRLVNARGPGWWGQ